MISLFLINILSDLYYGIKAITIFSWYSGYVYLISYVIGLILLIRGYLEYRKGSHIKVPPEDDVIAVSKE